VDDPALRPDGPAWIPVCDLGRLKAETIVRVAGRDMLVIWNEGDVIACERACPHEQADLGLGQVAAGRLYCPRHAASFDCATGRLLRDGRAHRCGSIRSRSRESKSGSRRGGDKRGDDAAMPLSCPTCQSHPRRGFAFGNNGILLCMGLFSRF
jgi:nitrite reductase/ring-hydroxylating ferredoxin subunit